MNAATPHPTAMHRESKPHHEWRATFGPFMLSPSERLLERDGVPVRLGGRALDLLIALVESAGEVIGKKALIARVWPDVVVEEGSLRFHMVAVRKALGDGEGGNRYIVNTANKGYTFVGRVERTDLTAPARIAAPRAAKSLPALASTMVGRDEDVDVLVTHLLQRRFVSVVGAGGIGKTTVAIAATQAAARHFDGDVHFVDLSTVSTSELVRATVAGTVGLQNRLDDLSALEAHLDERRALVVLDCCEHVIDEAAELAERLIRSCPQVHILATSREPLRADGEIVYRLQPLPFPPNGEGLTAAAALAYPAVKLFVDRATASGSGFEFSDGEAPLASQLCRELQGIALAIELAAGRIEALGLKAITSHFDVSFSLMWHGRRTAVPRHQTLGATLDWSYNLLSEDEQRLLRRLSVFAGSFSLDAAIEVCCVDSDTSLAMELIASLVSKSLVTVDAGGATLRYSLLETTKSYSWKKLGDADEAAAILQRFAAYFCVWAQQRAATSLDRAGLDAIRQELPNLRAALEWYFRDTEGTDADAVRLAASLCMLLMQLSQVAECARWATAALAKMPPEFVGSHVEVQLQGTLGQSLMYSGAGADGEAAGAYRRSIALAQQLGDLRGTLHLLNGYTVLLHRGGRYTDALATARQAQSLLSALDDVESHAIVDSLMGVALQLVGNVIDAQRHWEQCLTHTTHAVLGTTSRLGFDFHNRAMCGLARSLWLTGQYAKATGVAEETIARARDSGHAVSYCIALIWAGSVFVWALDTERMGEVADTLERVARQHSLAPYLNVANVCRGQMLVARGHAAEGVERIRSAVQALHECNYEMVTSQALTAMAGGLSDLSLHAAALALCDEIEQRIRADGDFLRMPGLMIVRGKCLMAAGQAEAARVSGAAAIELARSQGAKSVQVAATVALAQWLVAADQHEQAQRLLRPLVADAGEETSVHLTAARRLLG